MSEVEKRRGEPMLQGSRGFGLDDLKIILGKNELCFVETRYYCTHAARGAATRKGFGLSNCAWLFGQRCRSYET